MNKLIAAFLILAAPVVVSAQAVYPGNGNTGFGGVLGTGLFSINDNGTTITLNFTQGGGGFNDAVVIYIDSDGSVNIPSTALLTDQGDDLRRAISGYNGSSNSTINFPVGFAPDYAIAFSTVIGFGGLWQLTPFGSHGFLTSVNLTPTSNPAAGVFTIDFDWTDIGLTGDPYDGFTFVGTYLNPVNAFRANEFIGVTDVGGNPGIPSTVAVLDPVYGYYQGGNDTPLPIELVSWQAVPGNGQVTLKWQTASEVNNAGFEITRSTDPSKNFISIASYKNRDQAGLVSKGNRGGSYEFIDLNKVYNGVTYYYRLSDVAYDGTRKDHAVIQVVPTAGSSGGSTPIAKPVEFGMSAVYPNPFNPSGGFTYDVPEEGLVTIRVFNLIGQEMGVLMNEVKQKGTGYSQRIEMGNLSTGTYLVSVEFNGTRLMKKFTILK